MAENTTMANMTKKRVKPENCEDSLGKQKGTDQNEAEIDSFAMYKVMFRAFLSVVLPSCSIFYLVYMGVFDSVFTENGIEHYAERPGLGMKALLPKWMKMPLNSAVNFGYVIMAAYWCAYTSAAFQANRITLIDAYISYIFNFMAGCYGPIQLLRILTQLQQFAVLDQWYTYPLFMWVFVWGHFLTSGWNMIFIIQCMIFSVGSYTLTLYTDVGFEIALGVHIIIAIIGAILAYQKFPSSDCKYPFVMSILCCAGFVGLKLIDLDLPKVHPIFTKISGHFLSKIADIYQIHYVNMYFFALTFYKHNFESKKDK
ncbi:transmembrane protein 187-like [Mytilus galloprovincialis]|uniref:transmembrane protein 187-like n=1 Tax=Mytilus galloprovincialis TaxID=29158 RepID=UPI003F7C21B4